MGSRSESISLIVKVTKNRSWTVKNKCKYSHTFYLFICKDYSMALISALPSQFPDFHVRSPSWEWGHPNSGHCCLLSSINGLLSEWTHSCSFIMGLMGSSWSACWGKHTGASWAREYPELPGNQALPAWLPADFLSKACGAQASLGPGRSSVSTGLP